MNWIWFLYDVRSMYERTYLYMAKSVSWRPRIYGVHYKYLYLMLCRELLSLQLHMPSLVLPPASLLLCHNIPVLHQQRAVAMKISEIDSAGKLTAEYITSPDKGGGERIDVVVSFLFDKCRFGTLQYSAF